MALGIPSCLLFLKALGLFIRFMNEMQELTSSRLSVWLNDLATEFLLGTIEKPDLIFIFETLNDVSNVAATTTPLLYEVETIEQARGDVQAAEAAFNALAFFQSASR